MTNKTISITCDSDNAVALNAFSKALADMAQGHNVVGELKYKVSIDTTEATASLEQLREHAETIDTTAQQVGHVKGDDLPSATDMFKHNMYLVSEWVEMVHPDHDTQRMARSDAELEQMVADGWVYPDASDDLTETPTLDSEGLPWDARIHSTNKATVADGTWRLRRKPKELDEAQWQAEIKTVRNELEQLMAIELPNAEDIEEWENSQQPDYYVDPAAPDGDKTVELTIEPAAVFAPVPPPVVESHVDVPPPPVTVEPPVIVPPPPVTNVEPMTFPKLMTFLTERTGRITLEQVNELVAKHGLTRIDQLSQRPELIAAFVADVKTLLGE